MRKFDFRERRERSVDEKGQFVDQFQSRKAGGEGEAGGDSHKMIMRGERFTPTDHVSNSINDAGPINFNKICFLSQIFEY